MGFGRLRLAFGGSPRAATAERLSVDAAMDSLQKVRAFSQTAISPDGRRVAWVEPQAGPGGPSTIYVRELPSATPKRVSAAPSGQIVREAGVAWAPDGRRLAFLSDAATSGQMRILRRRRGRWFAANRHAREGPARAPRWSPDGTIASRSCIVGRLDAGNRRARGLQARRRRGRRHVRRAAHRDRRSVTGRRDPATSVPANLYVYDYDWSPDGQAFVAEAVEGSGTDNYWIAQLYVVDAATGAAQVDLETAVADRGATVVARRRVDRGHPRPHERRGRDRRRRLRRAGRRRGRAQHHDDSEPRRDRCTGARTARWSDRRVRRWQVRADHDRRDGRPDRDAVLVAAAVTALSVAATADVVSAVVQSFSSRRRSTPARSADGPRRRR